MGRIPFYCLLLPSDPNGLKKFKVDGQIFFVHPRDPDLLPSNPHAHLNGPNSPYKVHIDTGEIFHGGKASGRFICPKTLGKLRAQMRDVGLLGLAITATLAYAEVAQGAEDNGVQGALEAGGNVATDVATAYVTSVAVGGTIIAVAGAGGSSVTVGGVAAVGVAGASTVGSAATLAFGAGFMVGTGDREHFGRWQYRRGTFGRVHVFRCTLVVQLVTR